ncbi:hypothetical protein EJ06DRAFT_309879 [Trichodelitschia bisporula]|uniref:Uncharacterized protein n=1 Tax=Trichodelitschia bisporula TaxID=703511 RepID=A0A6G1I3D1_9PEZI|nr:hypothetical protein EJ06DRAFT_309879 [Trichodelitschia bisporula]
MLFLLFVVTFTASSARAVNYNASKPLSAVEPATPSLTITAPPSRPTCQSDCVARANYDIWSWQSYDVGTTITAATFWYTVYPKYNVTTTRLRPNYYYPEGYQAPEYNTDGALVTTLTLHRGVNGTSKTILTYPSVLTDFPTAYAWSGTLQTATAGTPTCNAEAVFQTVFLDPPASSEYVNSSAQYHSASLQNRTTDYGRNVLLVRAQVPAKLGALKSLFPGEAVFARCQEEKPRAEVLPTPGLTYASFVTVTSTTTLTNCKPGLVCNVREEKTKSGQLAGMAGILGANIARTEKSLLPPTTSADVPVKNQPAPTTISVAAVPAFAANLPRPTSPIVSAFQIGSQTANVGETITIEDHPVEIVTAADSILAVIKPRPGPRGGSLPGNAGSLPGNAGSLPGSVGSSPGNAGSPLRNAGSEQQDGTTTIVLAAPSRVAAFGEVDVPKPAIAIAQPGSAVKAPLPAITIGSQVIEADVENDRYEVGGQVLSLGGSPVTLRDSNSGGSSTVLSLATNSEGAEMLVVNGASTTLRDASGSVYAQPTDSVETDGSADSVETDVGPGDGAPWATAAATGKPVNGGGPKSGPTLKSGTSPMLRVSHYWIWGLGLMVVALW